MDLSMWGTVWVIAFAIACPAGAADDVRIHLENRDDSRVKPRIDAAGFAFHLDATGYLQKLAPTTIRVETQQKGRWTDVNLDTGRYLKADWNPDDPTQVSIESTMKIDLEAGERRFATERDWIQKEVQKRVGGRDNAPANRSRQQLLLERINAMREENIRAGADKRGKSNGHMPPLPRTGLNFEKPDTLEKLLKEQCYWECVAEVFKSTGFPPPDEKDADFAASYVMATEIQQALMGIKGSPRYLNEGQYNALAAGNRYHLTGRFIPELPAAPSDTRWKTAPAVRLADGLVKRATLEGGLDRTRGQVVAWWRVECDSPKKIDPKMAKGDGDCFWTWVETPDENVQYVRLLLHSPNTRYRLVLSLTTATKGEELTLYDGPFNPPAKAPF
jgi:hypothetical protein